MSRLLALLTLRGNINFFWHFTTDSTKLKLIEVIGRGSFGIVHMASWRGSLVAAKVIGMSPMDVGKIEREIGILE